MFFVVLDPRLIDNGSLQFPHLRYNDLSSKTRTYEFKRYMKKPFFILYCDCDNDFWIWKTIPMFFKLRDRKEINSLHRHVIIIFQDITIGHGVF